uniref:TATA-box-binding protein n=2 Tax=Steinernema glaseri TaxID=37863 RepID=A0A1I7ZU97_9BILA
MHPIRLGPSSFQIGVSEKSKSRTQEAPQHGPTPSLQHATHYYGQPTAVSFANGPAHYTQMPMYHPSPTVPMSCGGPISQVARPGPSNVALQPSQRVVQYGTAPLPPPTLKIGAFENERKGKKRRSGASAKKLPQKYGKMYVHNTVVTTKLTISETAPSNRDNVLDLRWIAMRLVNAHYQPRSFPAIRILLRKPIRASVNLFSTGIVVCTGTRSEEDARKAFHSVARRIGKLKTENGEPRYTIKSMLNTRVDNMVGNVRLGYGIDFDKLLAGEGNLASYEPLLFGALKYTIPEPKVTANIFTNGSVNLLGAKSMEDLMKAHEIICEMVPKYGKMKAGKEQEEEVVEELADEVIDVET